MCLALPAKVIAVEEGDHATVDLGGVRHRVNVALLDGVVPGEFVIVHVGYALSRMDPLEAEKTLAQLRSPLTVVA